MVPLPHLTPRLRPLLLLLLMLLPSRWMTAQTPASAACTAPEYRQFDFWVGSWVVVDTSGTEVGRNRIERALTDCVLTETWTGADGSKGRSFNIYDRFARRWHQTWVDDRGLLLQLDGGLVDGRMVLSGERARPDGGSARHRITFTPLPHGEVRQHWERSLDGGATWVTQFLGIYRRLGHAGPGSQHGPTPPIGRPD